MSSIAKYCAAFAVFNKEIFDFFINAQINCSKNSPVITRSHGFSTENVAMHRKEVFSQRKLCFSMNITHKFTENLPLPKWHLSNRTEGMENVLMYRNKNIYRISDRFATILMLSSEQYNFIRPTASQQNNCLGCTVNNFSAAGASFQDVISDVHEVNRHALDAPLQEKHRRGNGASEKETVATGHLCDEVAAPSSGVPANAGTNTRKQSQRRSISRKRPIYNQHPRYPHTSAISEIVFSSKNNSSIVEKPSLPKKNKPEEDEFRTFFRQPPIPEEFRIWTVAMMKGDFAKRITLQSPVVNSQTSMQNEWNRLATFADYVPPEGVFILPLAGAGFFLCEDSAGKTDVDGRVECAFCTVVVVMAMFRRANPMDVHRRVSPNCSFVLGQKVGNVTIADVTENGGPELLSANSLAFSATGSIQTASATTPISNSSHGVDLAVDAELPAAKGLPTSRDVLASRSKPGASATPIVAPEQSSGQPLPAASFVETKSDSRESQQNRNAESYQTATVTAPTPVHDPRSNYPQSSDGSAQGNTSSDAAASVGRTEPVLGDSSPGRANSNTQERQTVTYEDLGIISQKPKRSDMAVIQTRINTLTNWPHETTHSKDAMAKAGFYYTGHEDLVRCFHCKGGLKTWESSDTPWVEHARWFPRCPFIKLCKGQRFIDAVQSLNDPNTRPTISLETVAKQMQHLEEIERVKLTENPTQLSQTPTTPSLPNNAPEPIELNIDANISEARIKEMTKQLTEENEEIRNLTLCKMCQTSEVNVLFLPCGHLVACAQCAPALTTCAMCRQPVKGSVRVHLDDSKDSEREFLEAAHTDHNPTGLV